MFWRVIISGIIAVFLALLITYVYLDKKRKNDKRIVDALFLIIKNMENKFKKIFSAQISSLMINDNFSEQQIHQIIKNIINQLKPEIDTINNLVFYNQISELNFQKTKDLEIFSNLYIVSQNMLKAKKQDFQNVSEIILQNIQDTVYSEIQKQILPLK